MRLLDFIKKQLKKAISSESKKRDHEKINRYNERLNEFYNLKLTEIWNSTNENVWQEALNRYWSYVKPENIDLEKKLEGICPNDIKALSLDGFYNFLHNEYFVWKYTAKNRLATTTRQLERYKHEDRLPELEEIKNELFSFDLTNIKCGLEAATKIRGLGIAGASGLLALLYPKYFGTVDQFVVKALNSIKGIPQKDILSQMNPDNLKLRDGVQLIEIMKAKAEDLNRDNHTNYWTPRHIDKVLWTFGR